MALVPLPLPLQELLQRLVPQQGLLHWPVLPKKLAGGAQRKNIFPRRQNFLQNFLSYLLPLLLSPYALPLPRPLPHPLMHPSGLPLAAAPPENTG